MCVSCSQTFPDMAIMSAAIAETCPGEFAVCGYSDFYTDYYSPDGFMMPIAILSKKLSKNPQDPARFLETAWWPTPFRDSNHFTARNLGVAEALGNFGDSQLWFEVQLP